MQSLKNIDSEAEFRFIGGDQMQAVGGTCVRHYRELAYMGFIPVFLHLPTILRNMRMCKHDIAQWQPDALILVDYPGFNLSIAKDVRRKRDELGVRSEELTQSANPTPLPLVACSFFIIVFMPQRTQRTQRNGRR